MSDFIKDAMKNFTLSSDAWKLRRDSWISDMKFAAGDQWDSTDEGRREERGQPILTINRIPQFVRQVTNDQRQNRPAIKVAPTGGPSDVKTAEILQGLARAIETQSNADGAYDTAFEHASKGGFGWWRVILEYESDQSFNRIPRIKRMRNPLMVFPDPFCQEADYSDMDWAFVVKQMQKDLYKEKYSDSEMVTSGLINTSRNENMPGWLDESTVRIAEYYYVETTTQKILLIKNPETGQNEVYPEEKAIEGQIIDTREVEVREIKHCVINGVEKLEESDWPGKFIPLVPCLGEEIDIDGKIDLVGMVRHARHPQKMINYWTTCLTEQIALAPKPPWVGVAGQFEGHEDEWEVANVDPMGYLEYNAVDVKGKLVPPPQRTAVEPAIQAITQALMHSEDQLKAVMGIYDAGLGARSNETSGVAIKARQVEGDTANFHLIDNLARSIRHTGRIIVDLIPKEMPQASISRILGLDEQEKEVRVVNNEQDPAFVKGQKDIENIYNIGVGEYDVAIEVGPSFRTKRESAVANMLQLAKSDPRVVERAGDLIVQNMDFPGADAVAKRLVPPDVAQQEEQDIPPQIQQQMEQIGQMLEAAKGELAQAQEKLKNREMEIASEERIANAKVELKEAELQLEHKVDMARLEFDKMKVAETLSSNEQIAEMKAEIEKLKLRKGFFSRT